MNYLDRLIKKYEPVIKRKNITLDEISKDIKKTEIFLNNTGVKDPYFFEIPLTTKEYLFLSWEFMDKQKSFRFCLITEFDDGSFIVKPLIECPAKDRMLAHPYLESFIERFMVFFKEYFTPKAPVKRTAKTIRRTR